MFHALANHVSTPQDEGGPLLDVFMMPLSIHPGVAFAWAAATELLLKR